MADENKVDENKPDESKPEENKPEESKADESKATPPGKDAPDVLADVLDAVSSTAPIEADSGVAKAAPEAPTSARPEAQASARKYEDSHNEPHPHFRWHADVLVDGHDVYQGMVKDISMKGVNLLLDHNLQNAKLVKLHIHVPPLDVTHPHDVLEVSGKILSTVYDSSEDEFRSAISFLQFTLESDRAYLKSRLAER